MEQRINEIMEQYPHSLETLREGAQRRSERYQSGPTTLPSEYAARMNAKAARFMPEPEAPTGPMCYEDAKQLTWSIITAMMQRHHRTMVIDDSNRGQIQQMVKWFIQDDSCDWDLRKGICLFGPMGTYKSFLFIVMQELCRLAKLPTQFRIAKTVLIAEAMERKYFGNEQQSAAAAQHLQSLRYGSWCFDDLGDPNEPLEINNYGTKKQVMSSIISHSYDLYETRLVPSHMTTNLDPTTPTEISERYGTRLYDRMKVMYNFVKLDGESKRG